MDEINRNTLKAVGQTVTETLYREDREVKQVNNLFSLKLSRMLRLNPNLADLIMSPCYLNFLKK
jgi:hypothetical protein